MFKSAERDPLAVPSISQRSSVGPTRRTAAGGPPADRQVFMDPHATFSSEGSGPVGAGGGFTDEDPWAHDPHSPDHPDYDTWPVDYDGSRHNPNYDPPGAGEESFERAMMQKYPERHAAVLPPEVSRRLQFEAQEFLAQDHGCDDRSELLYRAQRHARTQTSTWTPEASRKTTEAFVGKVAELIPNRPRVAAVAQSPTVEDFDDQLLF